MAPPASYLGIDLGTSGLKVGPGPRGRRSWSPRAERVLPGAGDPLGLGRDRTGGLVGSAGQRRRGASPSRCGPTRSAASGWPARCTASCCVTRAGDPDPASDPVARPARRAVSGALARAPGRGPGPAGEPRRGRHVRPDPRLAGRDGGTRRRRRAARAAAQGRAAGWAHRSAGHRPERCVGDAALGRGRRRLGPRRGPADRGSGPAASRGRRARTPSSV